MRWATAVVVVTALALSACGSTDDPSDLEVTGSASPSATEPSPTRSLTGTLLDKVPLEPQRPADEHSDEGAIAFAEYALQVVYYAYGVGQGGPLTSVADRSTCSGCSDVAQVINALSEGEAIYVGLAPVKTSTPKVTFVEGDFRTVELTVDWPQTTAVNARTGKDVMPEDQPASTETTVVNVRWVDGAWKLLEFKEKN